MYGWVQIIHWINKIVKITNLFVIVQLQGIVNYNLIGHAGCYDRTCANYNVIIAALISFYTLSNRCRINILIKSLYGFQTMRYYTW